MSADPIGYGDGLNIYAYVGNDPVNNVDPWGLEGNLQECLEDPRCEIVGTTGRRSGGGGGVGLGGFTFLNPGPTGGVGFGAPAGGFAAFGQALLDDADICVTDVPKQTAGPNLPLPEDRDPDVIFLTEHGVKVSFGPRHTALEFTPRGGEATTLSAINDGGNLVSMVNNPTDAPGLNATLGFVTPPPGQTANQYFANLRSAVGNYAAAVANGANVAYPFAGGVLSPFDTIPNSNGFISGLINATGGSLTFDMSKLTNGENPVSCSLFL